jgi:hypothetical protein
LKIIILLFFSLSLFACVTTDLSRYDPAWETIGSNKPVDLRSLNPSWFGEKGEQRATLRSKSFALETSIYSIAAYEVYDKCFIAYESIPFPRIERWQPLAPDRRHLNTGFFARSWLRTKANGKQEVVIVFRGTNPSELADWTRGNLVLTNFGIFDDQYGQALAYTRTLLSDMPSIDVKLVGHSLGGGLAQFVQRYIPQSQAIVFAPSPNKGRLRSLFYKNSVSPSNSIRIFEKGEFLQFFRWPLDPDFDFGSDTLTSEGMKTRWIDGYIGNPISQHDLQDFSLLLLKIAAASSTESYERHLSLDVLEQLEMRRTAKQLSHTYYDLLCESCERKNLRNKMLMRNFGRDVL